MFDILVSEKIAQYVCAIDNLVSTHAFLLTDTFLQRQNFLVDEVISRMRWLQECTNGYFLVQCI